MSDELEYFLKKKKSAVNLRREIVIKVLLANGKGAIVREMQIRHYDDHKFSPASIVYQHPPGLTQCSKGLWNLDPESA